MSTSYTVSAADIINSYTKYQENMLVVDLANFRESGNKAVKYFDIKLKVDDSKVVPLRIKFLNQEVFSRTKDPKDRDYEQLKLCIQAKENDEFSKAMELVCSSYIKLVKDFKTSNLICDDEEDAGKNSVVVPNCKPTTPMQKFAKDSDGNRVNFDNPLFWFVPAFRRYKEEDLSKLPKLGFNYKSEQNKKFVVKEFDLTFYDLEKLSSNGTPKEAIIDGERINNTNIQKLITKGSLISGILQMQMIASNQSLSLNTKFASKLYVKTNHNQSNGGEIFDSDEFSEMLKGAGIDANSAKEAANAKDTIVSNVKQNEEYKHESDDEEEISGLDKIQGLSL